MWECPTCGTENAIEATTCRGCGTPFARLFGDERPQILSTGALLYGAGALMLLTVVVLVVLGARTVGGQG